MFSQKEPKTGPFYPLGHSGNFRKYLKSEVSKVATRDGKSWEKCPESVNNSCFQEASRVATGDGKSLKSVILRVTFMSLSGSFLTIQSHLDGLFDENGRKGQ